MYRSLPEGSPLYEYINDNCKWLLIPLTGHTNLVTDSLDKLIILNDNITIKASKYAGVSGCYLLALNQLQQASAKATIYIGSTTDFNTRYKIHKTNSTRSSDKKSLHTPLYTSVRNLGWENFIWLPFVITTNHYTEFFKINLDIISPVRGEHQYILRSFTQFKARIYEQALISHYQPKLNGGKIVVFPFMNWEDRRI